jgi:hypothetical protein
LAIINRHLSFVDPLKLQVNKIYHRGIENKKPVEEAAEKMESQGKG